MTHRAVPGAVGHRLARFLVLAVVVMTLLFACGGGEETHHAGLVIMVTSNLATPADLDLVRLEVQQEIERDRFDTPIIAADFRIPEEATLPATFAIGPGSSSNQNALIRVIGRHAGETLVLREARIQIPKTRVAALRLVLAAACVRQVRVDASGLAQSMCATPSESCQPDTGRCGPTDIDIATLPDYTGGLEKNEVLPIVTLDAGARTVDAGAPLEHRDAALDAAAAKSDKEITRFSIGNVEGTIAGSSIGVNVPFGSDLKSLAPKIELKGVSVSPGSGVTHDFSLPAVYTVTAEDGSQRSYVVAVTVAAASSKEITLFTVPGGSVAINGTNIAVTVPNGTSVTNLAPTIAINGASVEPASGTARDFTSAVTYTVKAADGTTQAYTVTVVVAAGNAKSINQFQVQGINGTITGQSIAITLPPGSSVTSLTPTITISGKGVSPASGIAQNFTQPVVYTVTAADNSTQTFTASVTVALASAKDITQFQIQGVSGTIVGTNIALTLPAGTNRSSLTPSITTTGTSLSPSNGVAQNFNSPVPYTVTAQDGSTKVYTVTVSVAASTAKAITQFNVNGIDGVITGTTINVALPTPTDRSNLAPSIVTTGVSVSPPSGTAQNFSGGPVSYVVTAQDASTQTYQVTVTAPGVAAPPTFSPPGGTYGASQTVSLSSTTPGASIRYTTDGTTPTAGSPLYSAAFVVSGPTTVKAFAAASGYTTSTVSTAIYSIPPSLSVSIASIDFGRVNCGATAAAQTLTLTNNGPATTFATALEKGASSPFTVSGGGAIGANGTVVITVTPNAIPSTSSTAANFYNDTLHLSAASVTGTKDVTIVETAQGARLTLGYAGTSYYAGNVTANTTKTYTAPVVNAGNVPATVSFSMSTSFFTTNPTSVTSSDTFSAFFDIKFTPTAVQFYSDTMVLSLQSGNLCLPLPAPYPVSGSGTN